MGVLEKAYVTDGPIELAQSFGIAKRRAKGGIEAEGGIEDYGRNCILLDVLGIQEEKQLVFPDRTPQIAAKVIALERQILTAGKVCQPGAFIAE